MSTPTQPDRWQARFLEYCKAMGRTPDAQRAHDAEQYPGGRMTGFVLWCAEQNRAAGARAKAHGQKPPVTMEDPFFN